MAFVSLSFPLRRRSLFSLAAGAVLNCFSCLAQPVLFNVDTTPYDNQMTRIRPVLASNASRSADQLSLANVNQWMSRLRAIPYRFSQQWRTPAEVNFAAAADCKGKAIALYQKMRANGARNLFFVIGKRRADAMLTHAWLEWQTTDGLYVLDPTFNRMAAKTVQCNPLTYIPLYAYEGAHKYRATDPILIARSRSQTTPAAPAEFAVSRRSAERLNVLSPLSYYSSSLVAPVSIHQLDRKCVFGY